MKLTTASKAVEACLDQVVRLDTDTATDASQEFKVSLSPGTDTVALLVNNLGASTALEIGILVNDAVKALARKQICVERVYQGTFMTSLSSAGFSISVLKLTPELLGLLDVKVGAPSWPWNFTSGLSTPFL